ncbi:MULTISPECIES: 5'-methylthioadenosine/S-adenosylhomocysteine nucleosidase family protein [unclassified Nostoc]|uniref:5'-methylthioadenosine/S-adenosylhomocysteine nucleosidase family protein n=1 Tax=unclassified Nostoc TaxID=2593658 RepID=UPI00263245AE|nr:hypothetical protein [Nostoc sp. S13]MDF5740061.1 hypothetical protein [Nostoc sp. S13]
MVRRYTRGQRPNWLHYKSAYGINDVLVNYDNESLLTDFLQVAVEYGNSYNPSENGGKEYEPNVMILDTFLSDRSDKSLLQEICQDVDRFPSIKILVVNPLSDFALRRQQIIGVRYRTPINKTFEGLLNILNALNSCFGLTIDTGANWNIEEDEPLSLYPIIDRIKELGAERNLELRFYDVYPSGPMYFFNDILVYGRFGATKNCMQLAWFMFVDDYRCKNDLFDENRQEFLDIWNMAEPYPNDPALTRDFDVALTRNFDIAIICGLSMEQQFVREMGNTAWQWRIFSAKNHNQEYFQTEITTSSARKLSVILGTPSQMGITASASLTTKMLYNFRPKAVILVGIAAGTKSSERNFGDILVAQQVVDHSSGKIEAASNEEVSFYPDPHPIRIQDKVSTIIKNNSRKYLDDIRNSWKGNKPNSVLNIHVDTVASGDQVINDSQAVSYIQRNWRKLVGIEMEAYGVYFAASQAIEPAPYFWCFKSVCDFADGNKDDNYQRYAAFTSAEYCHYFLINDVERLLFN